MGQYFRIVNLDKREFFEVLGDEPDKRPDLAPKTLAALARLLMTASSEGPTDVGAATES